jgi:hypothetical protein
VAAAKNMKRYRIDEKSTSKKVRTAYWFPIILSLATYTE